MESALAWKLACCVREEGVGLLLGIGSLLHSVGSLFESGRGH
jgi:hypothetical protein